MSTRPSLRQSLRQSTSRQSTTTRQSQSIRQSMSTGQSTPKRHSLGSRKKEKGSENETLKDAERLRDVDLSKYCPQKIFNVLFINETDEHSNNMMKKIIEMSKEFEDISYLTFITYDEVVSLLKNCDSVIVPVTIKTKLKEFATALKDTVQKGSAIPTNFVAKLMKIKLIEIMYSHYIKAVAKMQSRKKLVAELKALTIECAEKGFKSVEQKQSLNLKKVTSLSNFDYTNITIDNQDDIIFDDDIHHHISYYIFQGFYEPELLRELIVTNNVEIQSILKVTAQLGGEKDTDNASMFSDFWDQIRKNFDGPNRCSYLENTFLMTYTATNNDFKCIFEELLYAIRSITKIKLQHMNYIRHVELFRGKEIYSNFPLECFTVYNSFFQKFPMELVNIPILLSTLLQQVSVSVDETFNFLESASQHSYFDNSFEENRCVDPCSIKAFFKNKVKYESKPNTLWNPIKSFLAYEDDELFITLNSYKKYGHLVYDLTTKMLKNLQLIKDFNELEANYKDIIHKHDVDPSTKTVLRDQDIVLHFLYLFLFNMFEHKNTLPKLVETDLMKNLKTYNKLDFVRQCQTKVLPSSDRKEADDFEHVNLYNTAPTQYFWKEEFGSSMLLQKIFKAEKEFLYQDQRFSPETDTLLVQFSNCLDEFGINTKIHDQSLLTPVCIRDFCKYITVEQADWLEKNKPPKYVRKCVVREECQGAQKIIDQHLYPEYNYLIETESENDTEPDQHHVTSDNENEISFDQLIDEIKRCPPNLKSVKEYSKSEKSDKFLAYDFGMKYFQIKGATTTFHSHDDVKLTVDNTTMLDENSKCSICLDCRCNSLVLHSGKFYEKEDYNFHINLADGTIVTFIFFKSRKSMKSKDSVLFEKSYVEKSQYMMIDGGFEEYAATVLSVDQSYFENNVESSLLSEEYCGSMEIAFKSSQSMLERLKDAATSNIPIYKVNNNLTHVRKFKSEFEIPLATIVKRVLHNTVQREQDEHFTKRYIPIKGYKQQSWLMSEFDTRISLPNGLYISFYPSKLKKPLKEVKQEFLTRNASTELEEFRLFARGGYILIKKVDGSVTILKSNGDIVEHEKLDTDSENVYKWRTKPCHCKNLEDYRKRIAKLFKNQTEDVPDITVSRRAFIQTKKGYIMSPPIMNILKNNKVPYLKSSVLKFDGSRVCLEKGKVRVKKVLHVTYENKFAKRELYYERGDGFRCTIDRLGRQLVEFIDGTKIRSIMHVANDLVDGYVYVSLEFEYQHPNYATVAYRTDNTLEILLNNVVIRKGTDNMVLKIDEDITTTIRKNKVVFEKMCPSCTAKYTCDINIHPLVSGDLTSEQFIQVSDSYNKQFSVDLLGKCFRNQDYIRGPVNAFNCNHYSRMCYKKLFVVNRDLSGCTFWTDNMASGKKETVNRKENYSFEEYGDVTNEKIQVYKFKRNVYDHYSHRFLDRGLIDIPKEPIYATFRVIRRMVDAKTVDNFCQDLTNYFRQAGSIDTKHCKVLEKMFEENESFCQRENELIMKAKALLVKKPTCKCTKKRITIRNKIEKWREECDKYRALIRSHDLPCYFNSPFCKIIKK